MSQRYKLINSDLINSDLINPELREMLPADLMRPVSLYTTDPILMAKKREDMTLADQR